MTREAPSRNQPLKLTGIEVIKKFVSRLLDRGSGKSVFSVYEPWAMKYVRDPACFANGVNLTCASPWNSFGAHRQAGTLISKRHIALAAHYPFYPGTKLHFVTMDNQVVERTATNFAQVGKTDLLIGYLDAPVPDTIKPACLLAPEAVKDPKAFVGTTVLFLNQSEAGLVGELSGFGIGVGVKKPQEKSLWSFWKTPAKGDSGNPIFLINGDNTIMLSHFTSSSGGVSYHGILPQILDTMKAMGPEEAVIVKSIT